LAPGAGGVARLANLPERRLSALVEQASELERAADLLIIDCGAGLGPTVLSFLYAADKAIVITTPEPTAVADAYGLIKTMAADHPGAPAPGLLVNQARDAAEAVATHERIASVARRFLGVRLEPSGWIPLDPSVPDAVRRREPFVLSHPKRPAAHRVRVLAHDLRLRMDLRSPAPARPQGRLSRVFGRLARL
jgi:flagellar biosynthesis protein FlhG